MTDLQDAILDRLVGTPVGVNWPDGPLLIAAEVAGGRRPIRFGKRDSRPARAAIAKRLGFPLVVCEAIQGGVRGLEREDDRRTFAMTVFRTLPVGGSVPKLTDLEANRVGLALAVRVHPCGCPSRRCPVLKALRELLAAPSATDELMKAALDGECATSGKTAWDGDFVSVHARSTTPAERLLAATMAAARGMWPECGATAADGWAAARESVRVAAAVRGVEEAVACVTEAARRCGMAV